MIKFDKIHNKRLITVIAIAAVIVLAAFPISRIFTRQTELDDSVASAAGQTDNSAVVEYPFRLENQDLEISSLFQFSGINTDCNNQEGEDIASITLKNLSDKYLTEANITMTLEDDTKLSFVVKELPAGTSAMAFSLENQSIPADVVCVDVACEAVFDTAAGMQSDRISVTTDGTQIILTNISNENIPELTVYCRDSLGEEYFGGSAYSYTVSNLNAGDSTTVDAVDCILGMAEVVRIVID